MHYIRFPVLTLVATGLDLKSAPSYSTRGINHIGGVVIKRLFDMLAAFLLLIVLAPIMLAIAIIVRVRLGAPVLFVQERPGMHGKLFKMRKFRTMRNTAGADGEPLPDAQRVDEFGKWLRATSLDELPELWNVLVGQMSLVGPRPLLKEYLSLYTPEQARRHEVRPGVTGWAQVNGRNAIAFEEKFALDVWYVDNRSLLLDIRILWLTLLKVLRRTDMSEGGDVHVEKFSGRQSGPSAISGNTE